MSLNKIHVNSSTGLSLNDRFTAMAERTTEIRRARSRSRSLVREHPPTNPAASNANRRLLLQLERRHKMLAAMKLKRRSLRPVGGGYLKRGSIKAMRVAANGRPIKANSLTNVATMKADLIGNAGRRAAAGRSLRRAESSSNIGQRLGVNRAIGGAAERIAKRRLARLRMQLLQNSSKTNGGNRAGGNGRSRSRQRLTLNNNNNYSASSRGRSRSRSRNNRLLNNGRPQSRNRAATVRNTNVRRGRSMSRNRDNRPSSAGVSIKDRLGVRPGDNRNRNVNNINNRRLDNSISRRGRDSSINRRGRDNSVNRRQGRQGRNILRGRIDKRKNGNIQNGQRRGSGTGGNIQQARGRSRSRTRKGQTQQQNRGQQQLQQRRGISSALNNQMRRRGRSRQRGFNNNNNNNNNNMKKGNGIKNGQQRNQQQQTRGRSRSRRGGRNLAPKNNKNSQPNKDALDKELDQYMATTTKHNDLDYLLKN